jgi:hypothetical protein
VARAAVTAAVLLATFAAAMPEHVAAAPARLVTHAIVIRGTVAIVARDGGIEILDVADPDDPQTLGTLGLRGTVYDALWWSDSLVFLAAGTRGVILVDLTDPQAPQAVTRVETAGSSRRLARSDDILYVADEVGGLAIVDASRPDRARTRRTIRSKSQVRSVSVDGDSMAIAEGAAGVRLFDISRPDLPRRVTTLERRESVADVLLAGDTLLVADGQFGLRSYARDPRGNWSGPVTVSVTGLVTGLERRGDVVYVGTGREGIWFMRIVEPGRLITIGQVALPRSIPAGRAAPASKTRLLVAAGVGGTAVLDVTDLSAAKVLVPKERAFEVRWGD